jgi:phosphoglycerate dehydrogenase-like enzyme
MSILLLAFDEQQLSGEQVSAIKRNVPDGLTFIQSNDLDTIRELAEEVEIIAGWTEFDVLHDMPRLRWVQQWGAGANWLMHYPELRDAPFILTNAVGVHPVQISEHVFALILAFARKLPNAFAAQERRIWAQVKPPNEVAETPYSLSFNQVFELAGKEMLILGVGAIGERVAKLAHAFEMSVTGVKRNPENKSPYVDHMVGTGQMHEALPAADIVVNALPLTNDTRHLLGKDAFALMKHNAYLINIGRGGTIDEKAMIHALQNGQIAGAGLDVFEEEPLPEDSPLWEMPNVIITSHYAGLSPRYHERAVEIFLDNLQRYQNGQPLRNVVDKQLGY